MERLTNNIADKVASELKLDNDNKEVISYGMFALMHITLSIILVIIFGLIFHVTIESLIVCFAGAILRKYSGGAHANSPGNCAAIGTIICIGLALLFSAIIGPVITYSVLILLGMCIFGVSYYFIYKLAPVDSAAKPIKSKEKKARMKKGSIFVLCVYLVIVIINVAMNIISRDKRFLVFSLCIYGGVVWQVFTLTKLGHRVMHKVDFFLNHILGIIKREES